MVDSDSTLHRRLWILAVLWSLLFAKCFLLEYWIIQFEVPINSVFYIWSLSIFMAVAATVVFISILWRAADRPDLSLSVNRIWASVFVLLFLLPVSVFALEWLPLQRIPAIAAILIGVVYAGRYLHCRDGLSLYSATAWWISAGILFNLSAPAPLAMFAVSLILFTALPGIVQVMRFKRPRIADEDFAI